MKRVVLCASLLIMTVIAHGQIKGILERAKQKAANKASEKVDKTIDKSTEPAPGNDAGKKPEQEKPAKPEVNQEPDPGTEPKSEPATIKAYSKYDFLPGEKVIGFEDFSAATIGDFPAGWNTTASAEVVTIDGKPGRWLWFTGRGEFTPEFPGPFPEDFTFEFDLMHGVPISGAAFTVCIAELENPERPQNWSMAPNRVAIELNNANTGSASGGTRFNTRKNASIGIQNSAVVTNLNDKNNPAHISIWRQKERVRVYVNEQKIWDIPKAVTKDAKFNSVIFSVIYAEEVVKHFISNLRLAVGAPDTRKKILEQNKWVTHGILFDVNSASIKPESYGTLKEMADVLKEYTDLKVKIVGHTDSDGKDADNLDLSKRRAAAVKAALAKEFSIDEGRMETDGKGESEPMEKNDTPAGKANNRRVEFIKL
jgi:outer membrane protein OmpA-like peptidoglycan-associated protein